MSDKCIPGAVVFGQQLIKKIFHAIFASRDLLNRLKGMKIFPCWFSAVGDHPVIPRSVALASDWRDEIITGGVILSFRRRGPAARARAPSCFAGALRRGTCRRCGGAAIIINFRLTYKGAVIYIDPKFGLFILPAGSLYHEIIWQSGSILIDDRLHCGFGHRSLRI